ncbi:SDR family oxidoreductase [Duganella sp. CT11-25]|uniref:SDR family oxidoreductase n=1 Tax=unclassified Duganella TaxID=2636909 RepID=UPI0039AF82D5
MSAATVIVTGAGRGIGRAAAIRLAWDFKHVVIVARTAAALEETATRIREAGSEPLAITEDLRRPDAAARIVALTLEKSGRIDALVNVAGAVAPADLFAMSDAEWDDGFALKFHGARRLTVQAWDALKRSKGAVVLTSGASAVTPKASSAAIGAINAAINALAKAFSERGITDGVQVNSVLPGPVVTDRRLAMLNKYAEARGVGLEEGMRQFAAQAGISRLGQPDEIADLIAFLVSPAARWMTGAAVRMDGGEANAV